MGLKIAFIARTGTPNAYYRAVGPLMALTARGHGLAQVMGEGQPPNHGALAECDLLLVHRFSEGDPLTAMRTVHERGVPVVWDNDDDVVAPQRASGAGRRRWNAVERQRLVGSIRRVHRLASVVTTPSAQLAEGYREDGARNVHVIENYLPSQFVLARRPQRADDTVTIGWTAAFEHEVDARELRLPQLLRRLMEAHPQVRVASLGVDLGLPRDRYRRSRPLPFDQVAPWAASFDIGIAPLTDIRLNRARSNIKLKEYAGAGTPWVASAVGPYVGLGERQGGLLIDNDRWYETLERLVLDAGQRRRLGEQGLAWARTQTIETNAAVWERLLTGLVSEAAALRR
ncbi:hypothetical protein Q5424_02495 [Conexibacter sp. JD483]|uniref:hypothetical protein n=1 Tax=unclassified Conexibacter TaxID=2627773 RepID=UPI002727A635|nr:MULTISPECIES: hypothetical protein [unclassified Conexibacter]MDO8184023.1 hypothetical protein [Conexibacter sp. CPCC 205706]MDO8197015.1 hypothetical protein [Conexibacter sp. CPCC 205762]MDR9367931.1 hypothetical protein [Conexibacter sp. JD483]